jgi:fermentation-respiration switch protein FrsA (DUF1100 family)
VAPGEPASSDARRPATEKPAETVTSEEITLEGEGYELPSTRLLPHAPGPCIVFFAGSGPTDRDWLSPLIPGTNGSAAQLADALGTLGIGSLRFDKVGSGKNMKNLNLLSLDHYVHEATLAFEHLDASDRCTKVFLLGSSEGALHVLRAGRVLEDRESFGGLITMSGTGRIMIDVLIQQVRDEYEAGGIDPTTIDATLTAFRESIMALPASAAQPPDLSAVPLLQMTWIQANDPVQGPVVRGLFQADPIPVARSYSGPALVMSADHDLQVPVRDGDLLFDALASTRKTRVTVENANHVYKTEDRPPDRSKALALVMAYAEKGRGLAPGTVEAIEAFVRSVDTR